MKYLELASGALRVSNLGMGCMRLHSVDAQQADRLVKTALEQGINFFDHADIYGKGESERRFSAVLERRESLRERIFIQSKCGICPGYYDFSKEHILSAVDGILSRLKTEYLDVLLLHRPDALMQPEEVAEAFSRLHESGKVHFFGVSNHNPQQMELLERALPFPMLFNQLQFSLAHSGLVDQGMTVNMKLEQSADRDGGVLDYCRLKGVAIQVWSPFRKDRSGSTYLGDPEYPELNAKMEQLAEKYQVTPEAVAVAWITRHPANMQVLLGSMQVSRLADACAGSELPLTRAEWYGLYQAAGNRIP